MKSATDGIMIFRGQPTPYISLGVHKCVPCKAFVTAADQAVSLPALPGSERRQVAAKLGLEVPAWLDDEGDA